MRQCLNLQSPYKPCCIQYNARSTPPPPPIDMEQHHDEIIEVSPPVDNEAGDLPPLIPPAILPSEELHHIHWQRKKFRKKLQEKWLCNDPNHGICWREAGTDLHMPLDERQIEEWVDELVSDTFDV